MATMNLDLKNVVVKRGKFTLQIPDMHISAGTVGISGPNGSGKSTLLRLLDGLIRPAEGSILINGKNIHEMQPSERSRLISYLPQEIPSPFAFRALEVVKLSGYSRHSGKNDALECMKMLEIDHLSGRNFNTLSGGEKRLTMLAGLIYQDSEIILMDEPETYLDVKHRVMLRKAVKTLISQGKSIVTVIHDLSRLTESFDFIMLMKEGKIIHSGRSEDAVNVETLSDTFSVKFLKIEGEENRFVAMDEV